VGRRGEEGRPPALSALSKNLSRLRDDTADVRNGTAVKSSGMLSATLKSASAPIARVF